MTAQTIGLASVIMFLILLLFIPHPVCCVLVAATVLSIELGVAGYMAPSIIILLYMFSSRTSVQ